MSFSGSHAEDVIHVGFEDSYVITCECRTCDPGDSFAISFPFTDVEPCATVWEHNFDSYLGILFSLSMFGLARVPCRTLQMGQFPFLSAPSSWSLLFLHRTHGGGHSHPIFFVSDDRFRFCVPPFSLRIEGERFRRIHSIGKIVHTTPSFLGHPNTHVCARPRLQPRLPSIRNGHESHHACHVHAHEVLGTSSRHQERKGADRMGDDLPHWTRKRTT